MAVVDCKGEEERRRGESEKREEIVCRLEFQSVELFVDKDDT